MELFLFPEAEQRLPRRWVFIDIQFPGPCVVGCLSERLSGCTSSHLREVKGMKALDRMAGETRRIAERKPNPLVFLPAEPNPIHEGRAEEARR